MESGRRVRYNIRRMLEPVYVETYRSGLLRERAESAREILKDCALCPRECGADRLAGETGVCRAGAQARVASFNLHHGEEPPISGSRGSGTVFLSHCNLRCVFCQNYPISHMGNGVPAPPRELADMMLKLQKRGAHNINFVTPTHYMPQIIEALEIAVGDGLRLPIVYNCGGYESVDAVRLLDGIVDVYLPDIKYRSAEPAEALSGAPDYFERACAAVKEMFSQVGLLATDEEGVAVRGLIIRHLVLPGGQAGSREVFEFVAREISPDVSMSVMSQYFPAHEAPLNPAVSRRVTVAEYQEALDALEEFGMAEGWTQSDPELE